MERPADLVVGKDERGGAAQPGATAPPAAAALAARGDRGGRTSARPRRDAGGRGGVHPRPRHAPTSGTSTRRGMPDARLTTQRGMEPYWEDTAPAGLARRLDGRVRRRRVRLGRADRRQHTRPARRRARVHRSGSTTNDCSESSGAKATRISSSSTSRTRGRSRSPTATGTAVPPTVSPDRRHVAYTFWPHGDRNRSEIRVLDLESGAARGTLTGTPRMQDKGPAWSPDGTAIAYVSERSGWYEIHVVDAESGEDRQLTNDESDFGELEWHPDGAPIVATAPAAGIGRPGHRRRDVRRGAELAAGGVWSFPHWLPDGAVVATYEDQRDRAAHRASIDAPGGAPDVLLAPTPARVARGAHVTPEEVTYRSFDGLEIHGFLFRPVGASADAPVPAIVYPHGGPTDASATSGTASRSTSSTAATRGSRRTSAAAPATAATSSAATTRSGVSTTRRTASRRTTISRPSDWVDANRRRDRRRLLRVVHGAARGGRRPRAPVRAAPCASTATATSRCRGRSVTATAARTWSG